jgi:hypothetical protein
LLEFEELDFNRRGSGLLGRGEFGLDHQSRE